MHAIKHVNEVSEFACVSENHFFFIGLNGSLYSYADGQLSTIKTGHFSDLKKVGDEVWVFDDDTLCSHIVNVADLQITSLKYAISPLSDSSSSSVLICRVRENEARFIAQVDPTTKELVRRYNSVETKYAAMATERGVISYDKTNSIWFVEFGQTDKRWTRSFLELGGSAESKAVGKLIYHKNRIFIFLSDFDRDAFVCCISSDSGEVLQKVKPFGGYLTLYNNHIYVANPLNVRMLNVNTMEVNTIELTDILEPRGWRMMWNKFAVQGDHLYFVHQQAGGGDEAIVGIIDLTKKELLWHTAIPIEEGKYWVDDIQVKDNKLFVLTQGGTLHVFEQD